jgi:hypothetical protein
MHRTASPIDTIVAPVVRRESLSQGLGWAARLRPPHTGAHQRAGDAGNNSREQGFEFAWAEQSSGPGTL